MDISLTQGTQGDPGEPMARSVGSVGAMKGRDAPLLDPESPEPPEVTRDSPFTGGDGRPSEPETWLEMAGNRWGRDRLAR